MKTQVLSGTLAHKCNELQDQTGEIGNLIDDFDLSALRVPCGSIRPYPWSLRCELKRVTYSTCCSIASTCDRSTVSSPRIGVKSNVVYRTVATTLSDQADPADGTTVYDRVKEVDGLFPEGFSDW
jgi:hypothetical protein